MPLCIVKPVMLSLGLGFETRFFGLCLGLSLAFLVFLLSLVVLLLLLPLPLTVSCFSKIQIGFTFLVLAHLGSPGKRAIKPVCV